MIRRLLVVLALAAGTLTVVAPAASAEPSPGMYRPTYHCHPTRVYIGGIVRPGYCHVSAH